MPFRQAVDSITTESEFLLQTTTELSFKQLGLHPQTLKTLASAGYETPSPIQAELIPLALTGRDCIGQARTGTGKTAAFMLPTMERLDLKEPAVQVLALAPTRELSEQVMMEARKLCGGRIKLGIGVGGRPIHLQIRDIDAMKDGYHGFIMLTVDDYDEALQCLRAAGYKPLTEDAIVIRVSDEAGALAKVANRFAEANINLRSLHILRRREGYIHVSLSSDDNQAAADVVEDLLVRQS